MKNFNLRRLFKAAVVVGLAAGLAVTASAQQRVMASFLNGFYLNIPPQSTNFTSSGGLIGSTNSWVYATKFAVTNTATTVTNAGGTIINTYTSTYIPVYVTNANAFGDVDLWVNQDGSIPLTGLTVAYTSGDGTNVTISPVFTLQPTIQGSTPGLPTFIETQAQNSWSFTGPVLNGTNVITLTTNLPTSLFQGAHRFRLTISNPTNGTNGAVNVYGVWLQGFRPQPST